MKKIITIGILVIMLSFISVSGSTYSYSFPNFQPVNQFSIFSQENGMYLYSGLTIEASVEASLPLNSTLIISNVTISQLAEIVFFDNISNIPVFTLINDTIYESLNQPVSNTSINIPVNINTLEINILPDNSTLSIDGNIYYSNYTTTMIEFNNTGNIQFSSAQILTSPNNSWYYNVSDFIFFITFIGVILGLTIMILKKGKE